MRYCSAAPIAPPPGAILASELPASWEAITGRQAGAWIAIRCSHHVHASAAAWRTAMTASQPGAQLDDLTPGPEHVEHRRRDEVERYGADHEPEGGAPQRTRSAGLALLRSAAPRSSSAARSERCSSAASTRSPRRGRGASARVGGMTKGCTARPARTDHPDRVIPAVRPAVQADAMPAAGSATTQTWTAVPAPAGSSRTLRRKPLTARRAAVIIGSYTMIVTFAGGLVALADRPQGLPHPGRRAVVVAADGHDGRVRRHRPEQRYRPRDRRVRDDQRHRVPHGDHRRRDRDPDRSRPTPAAAPAASEPPPEFMREVTARLSAIEGRLDELARRSDD